MAIQTMVAVMKSRSRTFRSNRYTSSSKDDFRRCVANALVGMGEKWEDPLYFMLPGPIDHNGEPHAFLRRGAPLDSLVFGDFNAAKLAHWTRLLPGRHSTMAGDAAASITRLSRQQESVSKRPIFASLDLVGNIHSSFGPVSVAGSRCMGVAVNVLAGRERFPESARKCAAAWNSGLDFLKEGWNLLPGVGKKPEGLDAYRLTVLFRQANDSRIKCYKSVEEAPVLQTPIRYGRYISSSGLPFLWVVMALRMNPVVHGYKESIGRLSELAPGLRNRFA